MYASHDDEEGKIRIRFESLSKRLNKINVDILHKEPDSYHLQTTLEAPDTGALGCFTFDEFELLKTSDNSVAFKRCVLSLFLVSLLDLRADCSTKLADLCNLYQNCFIIRLK